jgi:hypothetical protein
MSILPSEPLIVVIDDERSFDTDVSIVYLRNSTEALGYLARKMTHQQTEYGQPIFELWLDHDLGHPENYPEGKNDTIVPVVRFLDMIAHTHLKLVINKIFVHSQNPVGSESVVATLFKHYDVRRVPLPELLRT